MKALTQNMIDSGKKFVEILIESSATPKAAFWIYNQEVDNWMLLMSHVDSIDDNHDMFDQLVANKYTSNEGELPDLEISDIGLAQVNAPILELLDSVVNTGDETLGINFSQEEINGTVLDGVYLYRMNITQMKL